MSNSSSSVFIASTEIGGADPCRASLLPPSKQISAPPRISLGSNEWVKPSEKPGGEAKNAL